MATTPARSAGSGWATAPADPVVRPEPEPERAAAPAERPDRVPVPDTGPVSGSIAATGPDRGRVKAAERARAARAQAPGTELRGPGPVSSARFPCPVAGEVLAPGQAVGTITAPARDTAPALGTGMVPVTVTVAGLAATPVVSMTPDKVAGTGQDRVASMAAGTDPGPTTPTGPTTSTVPRTATVTAMARPPLSPFICGRSSARS